MLLWRRQKKEWGGKVISKCKSPGKQHHANCWIINNLSKDHSFFYLQDLRSQRTHLGPSRQKQQNTAHENVKAKTGFDTAFLWEGGRSGRTATRLQSHLCWRFKSYRTQCHVNQYRVTNAFKKTFTSSSSRSNESRSWIFKMEAENFSSRVLWKPQNYVLYSWSVVMCHSQEAGRKEWDPGQLKIQL